GILSVSAKDKATNREQRITIEAGGGLSEAEIKRMVDEAKSNESADRERKEIIEHRNQLDSAIYSVEKLLAESGDKLPGEAKAEIEAALGRAHEAKDKDDVAALEGALDDLSRAS